MEINKLSATRKDRTLFTIDHLTIEDRERIGLVGRNGSGKTTLLEMIAGKQEASSGTVTLNATCSLLPQLKQTNLPKSGGEVTQAYIDQALASEPELLLADEPTTNLDTTHIEKLESHLQRWQGGCVIVSHDRAFLDALCTTIWEIADGTLHVYPGNYFDYMKQKEMARKEQEKNYEKYKSKKKQLEEALVLKEQKAQRATKKPKQLSGSEARIKGAKPYFANKQKKLRQGRKAIETRIEQLEQVEKPKELPAIKMDMAGADQLKGRTVLQLNDVIGYGGERELWRTRHIAVKSGDKVAVIGDNGSGKTTFLRQILSGKDGINLSPAVKIGYFDQHIQVLDDNQSILDNVMSDTVQPEPLVRTVLARLHFFREDVYKKVRVLSGGERVKAAFAKLFVSEANVLMMDEPTNFLDIDSVEALEKLLQTYEGTVLFATHDRRFMEHVATRIFSIEKQRLHVFDGTYKAFQQQAGQHKMSDREAQLFVLENRLSEVLGKLSLEPSEKLEAEFQQLLKEKKALKEED